MREALEARKGIRATFIGVFVRYGTKPAYKGPPIKTLLFGPVRDASGEVVTCHIWFTTCRAWEALGELEPGAEVQFDARVRAYWKGYQGRDEFGDEGVRTKDYKLSHPTRIKLREKQPVQKDTGELILDL